MDEYIEYLNIVNSTAPESMWCDGDSGPITDLDYTEEQPYVDQIDRYFTN